MDSFRSGLFRNMVQSQIWVKHSNAHLSRNVTTIRLQKEKRERSYFYVLSRYLLYYYLYLGFYFLEFVKCLFLAGMDGPERSGKYYPLVVFSFFFHLKSYNSLQLFISLSQYTAHCATKARL